MRINPCEIREGDLYRSVVVDGIRFDILYGYYEDFERKACDPIPVYPDLEKNPVYTNHGYRIVTQIQSPCNWFTKRDRKCDDEWCRSCKYFEDEHKLIGVCRNINNKAQGGMSDEKVI